MSSRLGHQPSPGAIVALALTVVNCALVAACGGSGAPSVVPPPPPMSPPPVSSIAVSFAPAASAIDMGQSENLTAIVTHNPGNAGVRWSIVCPAGVVACGAMASAMTASGAPNRFSALPSVSAAQSLTIKATSEIDPTKSASFQLIVNPTPTLAGPVPAVQATVNQTFSMDLSHYVQGGTIPFAWNTLAAALPAGLTLDAATGVLSGKPTGTPGTIVLHITATDSGTPPVAVNLSVTLTINAAPLFAATLTPSRIALFCQLVGIYRPRCDGRTSEAATLTNVGSASLNISNVTLSGPFTENSSCPRSLGAGQSCTITVSWNPFGRSGSGSLSVFDNAPDSPQSIPVTGTRF